MPAEARFSDQLILYSACRSCSRSHKFADAEKAEVCVCRHQGTAKPIASTAPHAQPTPAQRPPAEPSAKVAASSSASTSAGNQAGESKATAGSTSPWWIIGVVAVGAAGAVYAANNGPRQQVEQTKQVADELEISPGQHSLPQEATNAATDASELSYAPHAAPSNDQETSSVTGQALGPHELFPDREEQDRVAGARSHSTFHTDELAMPSSDPDHQEQGHTSEPSGDSPDSESSGQAGPSITILPAASLFSYKQPEELSQGSKKPDNSHAPEVDVHGVDRPNDSGVEASVTVDPTPLTDLLNEALTGEMLHPEHPGHEHTTLDDPQQDQQPAPSSAAATNDALDSPLQGADETDSSGIPAEESPEDESRGRPQGRQWARPVWGGMPETESLLQEGAPGPDEVICLGDGSARAQDA